MRQYDILGTPTTSEGRRQRIWILIIGVLSLFIFVIFVFSHRSKVNSPDIAIERVTETISNFEIVKTYTREGRQYYT